MALVNVTNLIVLDNPSSFSNDFQFEIEFECLGELEDDLEWKVTYVGSADDATKDQVLEEVMVGPVPQGVSKFVLTAEAPDTGLIPLRDLVGITVVLVTCAYREKEFVRIGYYVNNEYYHTSPLVAPPAPPQPMTFAVGADGAPVPQQPAAAPAPNEPVGAEELEVLITTTGTLDVRNVYRNIMSDKPRVTRFQIDWTPMALRMQQEQQQAAAAAAEAQQQQQQQQMYLQQQQQQQQQHMMMPAQGALQAASGGLPAPPLHGSGMMMGLGEFAQQEQQALLQQQQQQQGGGFMLGGGNGGGALGY